MTVILSDLIGVKYVDNGRNIAKDGGLDCWGLVRAVYHRLDLGELPMFLISENELRRDAFVENMSSERWKRLDKPRSFCVAVFAFKDRRWHAGVVMPDRLHFMHCRRPTVSLDRLDHALWSASCKGYYRYEK